MSADELTQNSQAGSQPEEQPSLNATSHEAPNSAPDTQTLSSEGDTSSPAPATSPSEVKLSPEGPLEGEATETESPPEDDTKYLAFKFSFLTPKRGEMRGACCLIIENSSGRFLYEAFWLTRSDYLVPVKTDEPWRSFLRMVPQLGPYDKVWGDKLHALLPDFFPEPDRLELFNLEGAALRRALHRVESNIRKGMERASHFFLDVSCDVENVTKKELEETGIISTRSKEENSDADSDVLEEEKSFEGTLIHCLPLVDPVWGKAAADLNPGDLVEVQIKSEVGAGGLVQQFLASTHQRPIFPVDSVERRQDKTYVYLYINEEIRGLITLTKDIRLKLNQSPHDRQRRKIALDDLVFFFSLGVALVGLIFAVRYLFF